MTDPVLSSLVRINRQRIRDLRRRLAPCGYLGVMHLIVLYVRRHPGARQEDVACFYAVDKTSVARDARRLEDMGHLRREVDPSNRRQYQIYLTDAGREVLPVLEEACRDFTAKLSAGVSPEDWRLLQTLLERLEENSCAEGTEISTDYPPKPAGKR